MTIEFRNTKVRDGSLVGWPLKGTITGRFAQRTGFWRGRNPHSGVDIAAPIGTPVRAPADGIWEPCPQNRSFGIWAMINHDNELWTVYCHLRERQGWGWGAKVKAGQIVGRVGLTGLTTGPHLHWGASTQRRFPGYSEGGPLVDPMDYKVQPEEKPAGKPEEPKGGASSIGIRPIAKFSDQELLDEVRARMKVA